MDSPYCVYGAITKDPRVMFISSETTPQNERTTWPGVGMITKDPLIHLIYTAPLTGVRTGLSSWRMAYAAGSQH